MSTMGQTLCRALAGDVPINKVGKIPALVAVENTHSTSKMNFKKRKIVLRGSIYCLLKPYYKIILFAVLSLGRRCLHSF